MTVINDRLTELLGAAARVQSLESTTYSKLQTAWNEYHKAHYAFEAAVARRLTDLASANMAQGPWVRTKAGWSADASDLHLKVGVSPNSCRFAMPPGFPPAVPWDRLSDEYGRIYWVYTAPDVTLTIHND